MARPQKYRVVGIGVDTFKGSGVGRLREDAIAVFDALQQHAIDERDRRAHKGETAVDTHWKLDGEPVLLLAHGGGKGQWRWLAKCPSASFEFGLGHLNGIGCQVRLASSFLWRRGYRDAWCRVEDFLRPLFSSDTWFQASEVHLCVDIAGLSVDKLHDRAFVTRSQVKRWHRDDARIMEIAQQHHAGDHLPSLQLVTRYRESETLSSAISVTIYNKPREIQRKSRDKVWFGDIWRANGWNGTDPVTRIEARIKREVLHEMGLESVEEVFDNLDRIWAYVTQLWIRHTLPSHLPSEEWLTSPWWREVQRAVFEREEVAPMQRPKQRNYQEQRVIAALLGYVESFAAWRAGDEGVAEDITLAEALDDVLRRADGHYEHKGTAFFDEVVRKRKRLGFAS